MLVGIANDFWKGSTKTTIGGWCKQISNYRNALVFVNWNLKDRNYPIRYYVSKRD
jgi:hypothetical protein